MMPFTRSIAKTGTIGRMEGKSGRIKRGEGCGVVSLFSTGCEASGRIGRIGRMFAGFRVCARATDTSFCQMHRLKQKDVLTRRLKLSSLCSLSSLKVRKFMKLKESYLWVCGDLSSLRIIYPPYPP